MKILIKSYLIKPKFSDGKQVFERDVPAGQYTIAKLLGEIGISKDDVGLFFVNKERVSNDYVLKDGDFLELIPLLDGG